MCKTTTGKTINQELSKARTRFEWLKKLQKNVAPTINRLTNFALPRNVANPPKTPNTLTLTYCGPDDPAEVLKARERVTKVLGPIDADNKVMAKLGRITMTFNIVMPTVELKEAA